MWQNYAIILVLAFAVTAMGIKALTPAGIQLSESVKLSRRTSIILGITTILFGAGIAVVGFVVIVLPHFVRR